MLNSRKIPFIFDFETFGVVDLKAVGGVKYALHPHTDVTFISYCFSEHDRMKKWSPYEGTPVPDDLLDVARNPGKYEMIAHNIEFDFLIWSYVFLRRYVTGGVRPPLSSLSDNMAKSNYFRLGSSLEAHASMIGIPLRKHPEGQKIMRKTMKPIRGKRYHPTPEEYKPLAAYGCMDTEILRQCHYRTPALPAFERWVWEWTFKRNLTGIKVDVPLLKVLKQIVDGFRPGLDKRFQEIVGCTVNSHVKVKEYFKQFYPYIEDMRKDTLQELLMDESDVPLYVREALDIKFLIGSSAIAKIDKALDILVGDRIYGLFDYAKAQTKRFAGKGVQPQNFPRFDDTRRDEFTLDLNSKDIVSQILPIMPTLKDPVGFVKNLLRRIWLPDEGKWFYAGDFSKIEPTMLFWLLDMGPIPKKWYEELAAAIYGKTIPEIGKDSVERQVGKAGQLSCGYGAGWRSFRVKTFQDTGILLSETDAKKTVDTYRTKYPEVVKFWGDLEAAFRGAVRGLTSKLCNGKITITPMPRPWQGVMIILPSGSKLYYHGAGETFIESTREFYVIENGRKVKKKETEVKMSLYYMDVDSKGNKFKKSVYGGLLCENVVSATAREVMTPAMWRLEQAGYEVLGTVHDEVWGQGEPDTAKRFEEIMSITPAWCKDAVIVTEVNGGLRYLK